MKRLLLICLTSFFSALIYAEPVATVLYTKNDVHQVVSGSKKALKRGMKLQPGDEILTGLDSLVHFKYKNGTIVKLGNDTNYKILAYSPDQEDVQIKASLNKGKLYSKTTGKKKENLKTPAVAMAILGTEYRAFVPNKTNTNCEVLSGSVSAYGKVFGPGQSFLATPTGVKAAPFPKNGKVSQNDREDAGSESSDGVSDSGAESEEATSTDSGSEGDTSSSESESEESTSSSSGGETESDSSQTTNTEISSAETSGASQVDFVSTNVISGITTTAATDAVVELGIADISIISCISF